ncbi:hypothetical protein A0256_17970 [Mucilaginibacter sp. PAMC 26640]|nr:hypothetical protein A0256_17970 [Mucilaginibacter sp. PAMC 26640]
MMKIFLTGLFVSLLSSASLAQIQNQTIEINRMKKVSVSFLKWYRQNKYHLSPLPIVKGFNEDTIKKDSVIHIDMKAVENYLTNFKQSGYVSENFINNLRQVYISVSDSLKVHPLKDYFGPVPGLGADILFGFGEDDVLDYIDKGRFSNTYLIYHNGLLKFKISRFVELVFTLTKNESSWLIDSITFDGSSKSSITYQ